MNNETAHSASPQQVLRIEGEMTIYRAEELKAQLAAHLANTEPEINLAAVSEIDSAGIQLLIWAKKCAAAQQKVLHLSGHSPAVLDAIELMNLAGFFGDQLLIDSAPAANTAH